jgi:transposase-like protein
MTENPRETKGFAIASDGNQIQRVDDQTYHVNSQNGNGAYSVLKDGSEWKCSCPDHTHRKVKCKHAWAVELSIALREKVASRVVLAPIQIQVCPICASDQIVKHGIRHNRSGNIQRYTCEVCGRWFVVNLGFERMKASPQAITSAMQLFYRRVSTERSEVLATPRCDGEPCWCVQVD